MATHERRPAHLNKTVDIARLVSALAERGLGTILGVADEPDEVSARMPRLSRSDFAAALRRCEPALVRHVMRRVPDGAKARWLKRYGFEMVWHQYRAEPVPIANLDLYLFTAVANEINRRLYREASRPGSPHGPVRIPHPPPD
jgi:DNA-directed RNA polymerase specialized sigma24 family protein